MSNIVYVLLNEDYDDYTIYGVTFSKERAEEWKKESRFNKYEAHTLE